MMGVVIDIDDRKRAEQALGESERRSRQLAESLPQLVWTCLPEGSCDYLSPQWVEYTGIAEAPQLGAGWLDQIHPADRERTTAAWTEAVRTGSPFDVEFRVRRSDGVHRWFKTRATPLRDAEGRVVRWFGTCTDVDDRIRAESSLRLRTEELARSNSELEQFAYVASHDLQEPLRVVASYVQLLERRYKDKLDADAAEFIGFTVTASRRMQRLINDLLDFSRVATRGRDMAAVDSESALAQSLVNLQGAIEESAALITHDPLPTVLADEAQLVQLWQNLLGNAIKFRGEGAAPIVHVSARTTRSGWTFSVRDNGIGIAAEYHERIFAIFQRLHGHDEYPGTGIGLAVCKKIVERHRGRIWVESEPGQGSTFFFELRGVQEAVA
jgi:PAS domain S-box-containing protein